MSYRSGDWLRNAAVMDVATSENPQNGPVAKAILVSQVGGGAISGTPTDRSGTVTTGGVAQQLAAANTSRRSLKGQNNSTGDLWISETGTAAPNTNGSYLVAAGGTFSVDGNGAVSIYGATTGQRWTATEVQ